MKTLKRIPVSRLEIGDSIRRNGEHLIVSYLEKDLHGFDVYATNDQGRRIYFFVADDEMVAIDQ